MAVLHAEGLLDELGPHQLDLRPHSTQRRVSHEVGIGEGEDGPLASRTIGDLGVQVCARMRRSRVAETPLRAHGTGLPQAAFA